MSPDSLSTGGDGRGSVGRALGKTFLQGLAAVLPLALTLYVLWWLGSSAERLLRPAIRWLLPGDLDVPGLGVALGLGLVLLVGLALRQWWARSLLAAFEGALERIPLVKMVYGSLRDLMAFFAGGDEKRQLEQVVKVRVGDTGLELLGLVTNENVERLTRVADDEELVAVYLPMSYQLGGFMALVPRDGVEPIDMGVEDALRVILTAGVPNRPDAAGDRPGRADG